MINDCEQCQAHDDRTRALQDELYHPEERILLSLLLGNSIVMRSKMQASLKRSDVNRLKAQRDIDFAASILGKIVMSFDEKGQKDAYAALRKIGIGGLSFRHEPCPHKPKADKPASLAAVPPADQDRSECPA